MARRPAVLATAWEAERVNADMVFVLRGSGVAIHVTIKRTIG